MSETENKDNQSNAGGNTEAAQSNRGLGDDLGISSGLRSANAGGSSQDATNVSNNAGAGLGGLAHLGGPSKETDAKST